MRVTKKKRVRSYAGMPAPIKHKAKSPDRVSGLANYLKVSTKIIIDKLVEINPNCRYTINTIISPDLLHLFEQNGHNSDFWPKRNVAVPIQLTKEERRKNRKKSKRKNNKLQAKIILTPIGGAPGYKLR